VERLLAWVCDGGLWINVSVPKSQTQVSSSDGTTWIFSPFHHRFGFSKCCNQSIASFITVLFNGRCKSAIFGTIPKVIFSTVDRETSFKPMGQCPLFKRFEVVPFSTNAYTSSPIEMVVVPCGFVATIQHVAPNIMQFFSDFVGVGHELFYLERVVC
jgi:hypothetical protein